MNMKLMAILLLLGNAGMHALAQAFDPGSNGSYGPLNVTVSTNLDLPTNGVFHCTTISVAAGATLSFNRNPLNTPVLLLATGDIKIDGIIDVSGEDSRQLVEGRGGPGGFDGGKAGFAESPPGAGYGPGGGKGGSPQDVVSGAGSGSYAFASPNCGSTNKGAIYGSPLLIPIVGGSGGGGTFGAPGYGGGGGGGAILLASKTRIILTGSSFIYARGGRGASDGGCNSGSGGGIRLIAPVVSGEGSLDVTSRGYGGAGRIRIDTLDRSSFHLSLNPNTSASMGTMMLVAPNPAPRLDIIQAGTNAIPEGVGTPVVLILPFGSDPNQIIKVQARSFRKSIPIQVVLTPDNGDPIVYDAQVDNRAADPAVVSVPVTLPVNQRVTVNAWRR